LSNTYTAEQWHKLSAEDKKRVIEGRQRSAAGASQISQQRNLSLVGTSIGDGSVLEQDTQTQLTTPTALNDATTSPQGQSAGDKRSNPESAGSYMSRR
jgi:hypothetical protein